MKALSYIVKVIRVICIERCVGVAGFNIDIDIKKRLIKLLIKFTAY